MFPFSYLFFHSQPAFDSAQNTNAYRLLRTAELHNQWALALDFSHSSPPRRTWGEACGAATKWKASLMFIQVRSSHALTSQMYEQTVELEAFQYTYHSPANSRVGGYYLVSIYLLPEKCHSQTKI